MSNLAAVQSSNNNTVFVDPDAFKAQLDQLIDQSNGTRDYYAGVVQNALMLALREYAEGGAKNPTYLTQVYDAVKGMHGFNQAKVKAYTVHVAPTLTWDDGKHKFANAEKGVDPVVNVDALLASKWIDFKLPKIEKPFDLDAWATKALKGLPEDVTEAQALDALRKARLLSK